MPDAADNVNSPDAADNSNEEWLLVAQGAAGYFRKVEVSGKYNKLRVTFEDNSIKEVSYDRGDDSYNHLRMLARHPNEKVSNAVLNLGESVDAPRQRRNRIVESLDKEIPAGEGYWKKRFVNDEGQMLIVDEPRASNDESPLPREGFSPDGAAPASADAAEGGFTLALLHDALIGGDRFSAWARLGNWNPLVPFPDKSALDAPSFLRRLLSSDCLAELGDHDGFSLDELATGGCDRDVLSVCYNVFAGDYFLGSALGSARRLARDLGLGDGDMQKLADAVFEATGMPQLDDSFFRFTLQDSGKGLLFLAFFALFGADGAMRLADLLVPMR